MFDFDSGGKTELDQMGYMLFYKWYFIWYYTRGEIGRVRNTNRILFQPSLFVYAMKLLTVSLLKYFFVAISYKSGQVGQTIQFNIAVIVKRGTSYHARTHMPYGSTFEIWIKSHGFCTLHLS